MINKINKLFFCVNLLSYTNENKNENSKILNTNFLYYLRNTVEKKQRKAIKKNNQLQLNFGCISFIRKSFPFFYWEILFPFL